jgi:hypothetical protein
LNSRALYVSRLTSCRVTRNTSSRSVSISDGAFSTDRPPSLSVRVHSLMSSVLFAVPSSIPPCLPFRASLSCRGFFPLRDIAGAVHSYGSTPSPAMFRPQAFSTSRRFAPPPVSWAYCIPLPRVGFFPFRGFSRSAAVLTHRQALPPCRYRADRSPPRIAATLGQTDFEALLRESKRSSRLVFSLPLRRSPLRISSSLRPWLPHRRLGYPSHPLMALLPGSSACSSHETGPVTSPSAFCRRVRW